MKAEDIEKIAALIKMRDLLPFPDYEETARLIAEAIEHHQAEEAKEILSVEEMIEIMEREMNCTNSETLRKGPKPWWNRAAQYIYSRIYGDK